MIFKSNYALPLIGIMLLTSSYVYADTPPKVVKAYLGVYEYNGTYYDPLNNTFEGESKYLGWDYNYAVMVYELDNGQTIRQTIPLTDNKGTTDPAPTAALSWTAPNGTTYNIFDQPDWKTTNNITPLPYVTEIPIGSQISLIMNDNANDDNYRDGDWTLNITENGVEILEGRQSGGYFHNLSFAFTDIDTNETWNVVMPFKNTSANGEWEIKYNATIPLNGSNATIYDITHGTNYQVSPDGFIKPVPVNNPPVRTPIPLGALIISSASILYLINRRKLINF
jgi:hypothetical protein